MHLCGDAFRVIDMNYFVSICYVDYAVERVAELFLLFKNLANNYSVNNQ